MKITEFGYSILVIDANQCFDCILTTTFKHSPLRLFTSVRSILHAQFGTFRLVFSLLAIIKMIY